MPDTALEAAQEPMSKGYDVGVTNVRKVRLKEDLTKIDNNSGL